MVDVHSILWSRSTPQSRPSDYELLRTYEPVLAFTQGEMFFPMRVDGYIRRCSLTARTDSRHQQVVAARGSLTAETLAGVAGAEPGLQLSLRFVDEPMEGAAYRRWHAHRPEFSSRGRLSRVGLLGRLPDAVFRLTFLLRGRVPGGTTAAAQLQYESIFQEDPVYAYHGRVVHSGRYTVLSYQLFYAMNDWRSTFHGVNDHEADWEQVLVYLDKKADSSYEPAWVAYASHDFHGSDLRRRWDDPELTLSGDHPVVYTGAGSHASYFLPGEYVITVELSLLRPFTAVIGVLRRFWRETLRQGDQEGPLRALDDLVKIPFVDYARGDGVRIGPGEAREWTPVLIDDDDGWVRYRGLWGLDTRDVFAGELAPAGPRFNRDGSVRRSWFDPIGWAELDREPTQAEAVQELTRRIEGLQTDSRNARERIESIRSELPRLQLSARALASSGSARRQLEERTRYLDEMQAELASLTAEDQRLETELSACREFKVRLQDGYREGPREHIRNEHRPEPAQAFREGRIAELWAAASIGLFLLLGAVLVSLGAPWFAALLILLAGSVLVDNILRGTVVSLLLNATIVLAVIATLVLLYEFFWWFVLAGLAGAGLLLLTRNIRELGAR